MPNKPNGQGKNARKSQGVALIRNRGPARFPWLVVRSLLFFQVTRESSCFFSAAYKLTLLHISVQYGEIFTENLVLLALCVRGTQPCVRPHKWLNSEYFLLYSQVQQRQLFLCVPYQKKPGNSCKQNNESGSSSAEKSSKSSGNLLETLLLAWVRFISSCNSNIQYLSSTLMSQLKLIPHLP